MISAARAHGVGGVVLVVEHVTGLSLVTSITRAPALESAGAQGLRVRNTIYRQERRVVVSTPARYSGVGCEDRISVTGDHLSFDGQLRCPRPALHVRPVAGDPTVYGPPFPLTSFYLLPRAGPPVPEPHATSGPEHVRRTFSPAAKPKYLTSAPPPHAPGNPGVLPDFPVNCVIPKPGRCRSGSSPLWGVPVCVFLDFVLDEVNINRPRQACLVSRT
jgi:hypothetical protein